MSLTVSLGKWEMGEDPEDGRWEEPGGNVRLVAVFASVGRWGVMTFLTVENVVRRMGREVKVVPVVGSKVLFNLPGEMETVSSPLV